MNERTPGHSITLDQDLSRGQRIPDQVVHDQIATQPRRNSIGSRAAQKGRTEVVVGHRAQVAFHPYLAFSVGRHGIVGRGLGQEVVSGGAVIAARGGEDKALHAGLFGKTGQPHGGLMVDGVGGLRGQIAQRVV